MTTWPTSVIPQVEVVAPSAPVSVLDTIRGNAGLPSDNSNPPAENRVVLSTAAQTDLLRDAVNTLVELSAILTDTFVQLEGATLTSDLNMGGNRITGLAPATGPYDLATTAQAQFLAVDIAQTAQPTTLMLDGSASMQSDLSMRPATGVEYRVTGVADAPTVPASATSKNTADSKLGLSQIGLLLRSGELPMQGRLSMDSLNMAPGATRNHGIVNLPDPAADDHPINLATLQRRIAAATPSTIPVGCVLLTPLGRSQLSNAYLLLDGSEAIKTTYPALYALIGDTFGQASTGYRFRLPDIRGRTIVMPNAQVDNSRIVIAYGERVGAATHPLSIAEYPAHTHSYTDMSFAAGGGSKVSGVVHDTPCLTEPAGEGIPHNNVQPTIFMNAYVRAL